MNTVNNKSMETKRIRYCKVMLVFGLLLLLSSCEDFVDIEPPKTQIVAETVFSNEASATSAITGIYSRMIESGFASGDIVSYTLFGGLSADELTSYSSNNIEFFDNSLTVDNGSVNGFLWKQPYEYIYSANAVIEGLDNSSGVSEEVKQQLEGEAKFIRAFCFFYLTNLFGDVPLHLTTDYRITSIASRTLQSQVYQQIITDLKDAQSLLTDDYTTEERVRPNRSVATALLARAYLYTQDWANAEIQASTVITNSGTYVLENDLNNVFLAVSSEAIWQLKPVQPGVNTNEGRSFILTGSPVNEQGVALSNELMNAFETGDNRFNSWVNSFDDGMETFFYPFKYKIEEGDPGIEYSMVLRLAEQYLIRAEARAQQENIAGAQTDLNRIRNRAGLGNTTANDRPGLLLAIEQERQVELFMEWGHRWLDLKRTNRSDAVLEALKSPNWEPTDTLYPIPQRERESNPNITQNLGYQ